jgi:hypothetical protein
MNGKDTLHLFTVDIKAKTHYTQDQKEQPDYLFPLPRFAILNPQTDFCCNNANNEVTACTVFRTET